MVRPAEHDLGRAELHEPPEIQHRDAIREVAHDAEVVRDEEVGGIALGLQLDEQVEDRGLHGHVERGGGLVADDEARLARERAGDRDALLLAARELRRALQDGPIGKADRLGQRADAIVGRLAGDAGQALERAAQDAPHGVPAVERRVRVLEDDLERAHVGRRALRERRRELPAVERDGARGRLDDAEQRAGERRLAAARLADEPERLTRPDHGRDAAQRVHARAVLA